jgi:hypothetical protein
VRNGKYGEHFRGRGIGLDRSGRWWGTPDRRGGWGGRGRARERWWGERVRNETNLGGLDGVLFNGLSQASGVGQGGHAPPWLTLRVPQCHGLALDSRNPVRLRSDTLGQRGDIYTPGPWDRDPAPYIQPPRGIQIGAIQLFFFFRKERWHHLWAVPYERAVNKSYRLPGTRCPV